MKIFSSFFLIFLATLLFYLQVQGVIYVAPGGTGNGDSEATPLSEVKQAVLNATIFNNEIVLLPGVYNSTSDINPSPTINIIIRSRDGPGVTIFDCLGGGRSFLFFNNIASSGNVTGITVRNCYNYAIRVSLSGTVNIKDCRFISNVGVTQGAVLVASGQTVNIDNSYFLSNTKGILSGSSSEVVVRNCVFDKNSAIGIVAPFNHLTVQSSVFSSNSQALDMNSGTNATISSCSFMDNGINAISCNGIGTLIQNDNFFCGETPTNLLAVICPTWGNLNRTYFDGCKVCNGVNTGKDCLGTCWGTATGCQFNTIWVATNGTGNGTLENFPRGDIQGAIDSASYGDTIILLPGIFNISSSLNTKGKAIRITKHPRAEAKDTIIRCTALISGVVVTSGENSDTVLDSITITACARSAVVLTNSTITIKNSILRDNRAIDGASVYIGKSTLFLDNTQVIGGQGVATSAITVFSPAENLINSYLFVKNSRFFKSIREAIYASAYSSIDIDTTSFSGSRPTTVGETSGLKLDSGSFANVRHSSFFNNTENVITCVAGSNVNNFNTTLCAGTTISCVNWVLLTSVLYDSCGICSGNDNKKDCSGECYATRINDTKSSCCYLGEQDCKGVCFGTARTDKFGLCCNASDIDCENICFGNKTTDQFGTCCSPSFIDCNNTCFGGKEYDNSFPTQQCCFLSNQTDCNGTCFGPRRIDDTIPSICCLPSEMDCNRTCFGSQRNDSQVPPVCCFPSAIDCNGTCYGQRQNDTSSPPSCCFKNETDCNGTCFGLQRNDSSAPSLCCFSSQMDCNSTCFGKQVNDSQVPPICCFPGAIDCNGTCYGSRLNDTSYPPQCCFANQTDCEQTCFGSLKNDTRGTCCHPNFTDCSGICSGGRMNDTITGACCFLGNETDCTGSCFGTMKNDTDGGCCEEVTMDCKRVCNGGRKNDTISGACCFLGNETDCLGACFGTKKNDSIGGCCEEVIMDCERVCDGLSRNDTAGVCCLGAQIVCGICNGADTCATSQMITTGTTAAQTSSGVSTSSSSSTSSAASGTVATTSSNPSASTSPTSGAASSDSSGVVINNQQSSTVVGGLSDTVFIIVIAIIIILLILAVVAIVGLILAKLRRAAKSISGKNDVELK